MAKGAGSCGEDTAPAQRAPVHHSQGATVGGTVQGASGAAAGWDSTTETH